MEIAVVEKTDRSTVISTFLLCFHFSLLGLFLIIISSFSACLCSCSFCFRFLLYCCTESLLMITHDWNFLVRKSCIFKYGYHRNTNTIIFCLSERSALRKDLGTSRECFSCTIDTENPLSSLTTSVWKADRFHSKFRNCCSC